jgi:hypothetical protein
MLDILEGILPIGTEEWQAVEDWHNAGDVYNRTLANIRKKLHALKNKNLPTSDPDCPPAVRRARHIFLDIGERCDASDASEDYVLRTTTLVVVRMVMVLMETNHLLLLVHLYSWCCSCSCCC